MGKVLMKQEPVLVASGITKRYGGVAALTEAGFELKRGEILGLCGENGAGKSTLIKILGGIVIPDSGSLSIGGAGIVFGDRPDPSLLSIVHQELSVVPHLSVLDNIMMGRTGAWGLYLRRSFERETRELLQVVGLQHIATDTPAGTLTLAEQQLIEIARGIASNAQVLLLDEPTATLSDAEINKVFTVLRQLRERGTSIVIVSHRLAEVFSLTDRITVFRNGRHIFTKPTSDLTPPELVRAMIGRDVVHKPRSRTSGEKALTQPKIRAEALKVKGSFGPVDIEVRPGEIVAIVGQLGSGADAVLETFAGLREPEGGKLIVDGVEVVLDGVSSAYDCGIAYVAEDRAARGVFLDASIEVNITSQILDKISPGGLISAGVCRERAISLARSFQIDPGRITHNVSTLSGGNQQKVSLAKAVALEPSLLLLNEPTRGVDVGARSEIYDRLHEMADAGLAVAFYSTDLEEVVDVSDRVITIYRGRVVRDVGRDQTDADEILQDILHGQLEAAE